MRVLALDMALTTGWAIGNGSKIEYGHFAVHHDLDMGSRFVAFRDHIVKLLVYSAPTVVWYERPCGHSGASVDLARGFQALLLIECKYRSAPARRLAPNTLKKDATGNGRCGKEDMFAAACRILGPNNNEPTFDEADAICLLQYALEHEE